MKITHFKTYSLVKVKKAIHKLQLNTLEHPPKSGLMDQRKQEESLEKDQDGYALAEDIILSTRLKKRIADNRQKLLRKPATKKIKLRKEIMRLLTGVDNRQKDNTKNGTTIKSIPIKRYTNQDAYMLKDRDLKVLKYLGNDRDPYYQLRNINHVSYQR